MERLCEDLPGLASWEPSSVTDGTDVEGLTSPSHLGPPEPKFISAYQPFLTQTHIHRPESLEHRPFMSELMGVSQQPICENSSSAHRAPGEAGQGRQVPANTWPTVEREPGASAHLPFPGDTVQITLHAQSSGQACPAQLLETRPQLSPTRPLCCKQPRPCGMRPLGGLPGSIWRDWLGLSQEEPTYGDRLVCQFR